MTLPISSAPKDGTLIWVSADGLELPMRWDAAATNHLLGDESGLWVMNDGSATWCDRPAEYGPTHWRPIEVH